MASKIAQKNAAKQKLYYEKLWKDLFPRSDTQDAQQLLPTFKVS